MAVQTPETFIVTLHKVSKLTRHKTKTEVHLNIRTYSQQNSKSEWIARRERKSEHWHWDEAQVEVVEGSNGVQHDHALFHRRHFLGSLSHDDVGSKQMNWNFDCRKSVECIWIEEVSGKERRFSWAHLYYHWCMENVKNENLRRAVK